MKMNAARHRIIHISTVHRALDVRIFYKECRTLAVAGYDVCLAVFDPPASGKLEDVTFCRIERVFQSPLWPQIMGRVRSAFRASRHLHGELYHLHDPELIPLGLFLKLKGLRVIYDVHEDSPREALSQTVGRPLRGGLYFLAWVVLEQIPKWLFDGIVAATPAIAERFPAKKTRVVQNYPVRGELNAVHSLPYAMRRPLVVYVGGIAENRGISEIVRAMNQLPDNLGARLGLAGRFDPPELEHEIRKLPGWACVEYSGWLSRDGVARLLGRARVGLVILHPRPEFLVSQPIKLYEYMAAGLPIVASDFPMWRELIEPLDNGILVDPLDAQAIAEAIRWLLEHPSEAEAMGRRGIEAVKTRFDWETEGRRLVDLYRKVLP